MDSYGVVIVTYSIIKSYKCQMINVEKQPRIFSSNFHQNISCHMSVMDLQNNVLLSFCPQLQRGEDCNDPNCPYIHVQSGKVNLNQLLNLDDAFFLKSQSNDQQKFIFDSSKDRTMFIDPKQTHKPILCQICSENIHIDNCVMFNCCHTFCCKNCIQKWKFKNCCPNCGKSEQIATDYDEIKFEIENSNKIFNNFTFHEEKLSESTTK